MKNLAKDPDSIAVPVLAEPELADSVPVEQKGTSEPPVEVSAATADEADKMETALIPTDSLSRYMAEIRRYALLSPEEEHELAVQYKEYGDVQAAYRLVTANLRLVVMIARSYQRAFQNLLDLIQEGNVGLMDAVRHFDPYRGVRFPSYAVWWVRAYIIRYIMNNWRMVKLGTTQAQRKLFFNLQKEKERLEAEGYSPEPKRLAHNLGVKEREVVEMEQRMAARDLSVDAPLNAGDESATFLDFLADQSANTEEAVSTLEYQQLIRRKLTDFARTLEGKEEVIFNQRLFAEEPLTLQDIGDQYGISRERVRQLESRLKKKLKEYLVREIPDLTDLDIGLSDAG
ncbi:MAG: RNA polymerase factor sigma-32 [Desulfurellaceae bacterium]|nr:RNA polymerase factor sigma-32 [Desulfurellaceae bacterium]